MIPLSGNYLCFNIGTGQVTTRVYNQSSHPSLVVKNVTCANAVQWSATCLTRGFPTYRIFGISWDCRQLRFAQHFHPLRTERFLESTDIWFRSLTWYSQTYGTSMKFSGTGRHLSFVTYPELEDLPNIREISWKCQHLSLGIFLKSVNLPNLREVLPLVLLSQIILCVCILPIVFQKFVDRHWTIHKSLKLKLWVNRIHACIQYIGSSKLCSDLQFPTVRFNTDSLEPQIYLNHMTSNLAFCNAYFEFLIWNWLKLNLY